MKVSLLTSTYNWPEALELFLLSVFRQSRLPDEILIADDGSGESTRTLIDSMRSKTDIPIQHIWHEDEGYRKVFIMNKAMAKVNGDYIVEADGDVILHPKFIEDHVRFSQPGTYCAGSRILFLPELTEQVFAEKRITFGSFEKGMKRPVTNLRLPWLTPWLFGDTLRYDNIRGSNMAFWYKDARAVNGYNEEIGGWGRDDTEFVARLTFSGIKRRKVKFAAKQYHLYHPEFSRDYLEGNDEILSRTIEQRLTRCSQGIVKD